MEDQYCRLCMGEDNLIEMDNAVLNCIKNAFSIEVQNNDGLSKEICERCHEFVVNLVGFSEKVSKVQKLLQKILKRKDVNHVDTADCINKTIEETPLPVVETYHPCPTPHAIEDSPNSNVISKAIKSLNLDEIEKSAENMNLLWNSNQNNFCKICARKFSDFGKFSKHLRSSTHIFKANVIERTGEANIFSTHVIAYTCSKCSKTFTSKTILADHIRNDHDIKCNKNSFKPDTLIRKMKKNEDFFKKNLDVLVKEEPGVEDPKNRLKKHHCGGCQKYFGFEESLRRHIKRHHADIMLCMHCNFTTINKRRFIDHLRLHYDGYTHRHRICSKCFKVCESQSDLLNHRNEAHATLVCSICNQTFKNSTSLKKHKRDIHRTHTEVIPDKKLLKCRRCHRGFTSLLVLEKHQCTAMKYPCVKNCGKRFESYSIMQRHAEKCNSGSTIYSCKKCNKPLKTIVSLKKHIAKCSSKISSSSTSESSKLKISREKPEKKIETLMEYFNEEIEESNLPLIEPSQTETDAVSNKSEIYSAESSKNERMKTVPKIISTALTKHKKETKVKTKTVHKESILKHKRMKRRKSKRLKKIRKNLETQNALEKDKSLACQICGVVFKDQEFLAQHELIAHSSLADEISKTTTECTTSKRHYVAAPLELPKSDVMQSCEFKWRQKSSLEINQNVKRMRHEDTPTKSTDTKPKSPLVKIEEKNEQGLQQNETNHHITDRSAGFYESVNHSNNSDRLAEIRGKNEKNERIPQQNNCIVDRSAEMNVPSAPPYTSNQFDHLTDRQERTPRPKYQSSTPWSTPKQNDHADKTASRNHLATKSAISEQQRSRWDCPYNPKTPSSSQSTCLICKNPNRHLYCNPCCRCFLKNQVQYLNHMKMKHLWYVFTFIDLFRLICAPK